jgi:hypothetical protein
MWRLAILWLLLPYATCVLAQPSTSSCDADNPARGLSQAEELLRSPAGNLLALACATAIADSAQARGDKLDLRTRLRLASIATSGIAGAGGSGNVGEVGGHNENAARLWLDFVRANPSELHDRRAAFQHLIEHGRFADFMVADALPAALGLLPGLKAQLPEQASNLLLGTLYRCPNWKKPQARNIVKQDEVPCHPDCANAAKQVSLALATWAASIDRTMTRVAEVRKMLNSQRELDRRLAACPSPP